LGLFALIVNAIVILLVSKLVDGFEVESIFWALLFGIIQSVIASFLFWLF
jgi:putative membrane protein